MLEELTFKINGKDGIFILNSLHQRDQLCAAGMEFYFGKLFENKNGKILNNLNEEQKYIMSSIYRSVLQEKSEFFLVNGMAGTGKTTMAITLMKALVENGFSVAYITGYLAMVDSISIKIKEYSDDSYEIYTISSFLKNKKKKNYDVLIVDEAQRIGTTYLSDKKTKVFIYMQKRLFFYAV